MKDKLCLIVCDIFKDEILSVIHSENLENVVIETIPCICYKSCYRNVNEIKVIIARNSDKCSQFEIIGGACNRGLESLVNELKNCHMFDIEQCFYLFTNKTIIDSYISEGNYFTTPGWLKHWEDYVKDWGFSKETASEFFREYEKQILLLDTGVDKQSAINLKDFSDFAGLPYKVLEVGLDYLQMLLLKIINDCSVHKNANKYSSDFTSLNKMNADNAVALKNNENLLRQITDNMEDIIGQTDTNGIYVYISPACESILGYKQTEMIGKKSFQYLHPEDRNNVDNLFKQMKETWNSGKIQFRTRHVDGRYIWLESSGMPLINNSGNVIGYTFCNREITFNKLMEEKLIYSEKKYRKLIEFLPEAVFVHDAYKILFCNKAALNLIGVESYDELIGKPILEFIPSKNHTALLKNFKRTLEGGDSVWLQGEKLIQSSGKVINIESNTALFQFEEKPAILHVMKDITERKQMEQMKKKMEKNKRIMNEMLIDDRLKSEFFANISHEFRTPLNIILGTLQLVELYQKSNSITNSIEVLNKYIPAMKQNCFRLLRLINNLIDITRIDSGYFELHQENNNIVDIIKKIILSVEEYVQAKNLTINFKTEIEEKIMACDPDKIERIILNLLSNAIKFTEPEGSITVNIYDQVNKIAIVVADTGIGIPQNKQNLVFDRFRQVDKSLARKSEGSGIGLAIVKSLVEMHHGNITLKSIHNKGSEFTILLPVKVLDKKGPSTGETRVLVIGNLVERIKIEFSDIYL